MSQRNTANSQVSDERTKAARQVGAQSRAPKTSDLSQTTLMPDDPREIGRALAVEQMLKRSSQAAAAARRVEAEQSAMLQGRQADAVRKVFTDRRAAKLNLDQTSSTAPERTTGSVPTDPPQGSRSLVDQLPARPTEVQGTPRRNPKKMDQSMAEKMRAQSSSSTMPAEKQTASFNNPYLPRSVKALGKPDRSKSFDAKTKLSTGTSPRSPESPTGMRRSSTKFNPFLPRGVNFE